MINLTPEQEHLLRELLDRAITDIEEEQYDHPSYSAPFIEIGIYLDRANQLVNDMGVTYLSEEDD